MFKNFAAYLLISLMLVGGTAQAQGDIVHKKITVASTNDEWTQTGIKAAKGDILIVLEHGNQVKVGPLMGYVTANGTESGVGALYMKIGTMAGSKVGAKGMVIVTEPGVVKLKVNDSIYGDNSGNFVVSIIQVPGSAIPPATLADME